LVRTFYKGTRLDGWDFYTGNTINYRENIGKTVRVPKDYPDEKCQLCHDSVLHASQKPNDIFIGSKVQCSVFVVTGKPVIKDKQKCGFKEVFVVEEIPQDKLDDLFGWRYSEACNLVHPLKIEPPKIGKEQVELLKEWASVWASVRASIWASVRASLWASVWDSVWAYIGSLFPNIKKWKYVKHRSGEYPFQSAVELWKQGLVPSFDGETWRLHGGKNAKILYEISKEELQK